MATEIGDIGIPGISGAVEIGRGGFATVYRAEQTDLGRTVAVKVLTGVEASERHRTRFMRELTAMGRLSDHPYVVPIHDAGFTSDGRAYIVMAYMPGGSLAARLNGGAVNWKAVLDVLVKVASALEAAHQSGVVHADVKPGNVLLSRYGQPLLSDFGIAHMLGDAVTMTRSSIWTAAHVAPEVLRGDAPTPAADIYSLGSTGYALLRGLPPYVDTEDDAIAAVLQRVLEGEPPSLDGVCPPELEEVLKTAIAKRPEDRQPSALALARELTAAQAAAGLERTTIIAASSADLETAPEAAPPAFGRRVRRRARRLPLAATVAIAAVVGGGAFIGGGALHPGSAGPVSNSNAASRAGLASPTPVPVGNYVYHPLGVAVLKDGSTIFTDLNRIWRVDSKGGLHLFAGSASAGYGGDGGLATQALLNQPTAVAVDAAGNVFVADSRNSRVREIRGDGTIITAAGNGTPGLRGDGGPATEAELDDPEGLAIGPDGALYIADQSQAVIRRVDNSGIISPFAGSTDPNATNNEGQPASNYGFGAPNSMAFGPAGVLYVIDGESVLKIGLDHRVTTYVGASGVSKFSGDGGPATGAGLDGPLGIATDPAGDLFIADSSSNRIREVTAADHKIRTIVGDGNHGLSPRQGAALNAELNDPEAVWVASDGSLLIADSSNARVLSYRAGQVTTIYQYTPPVSHLFQ